MSASSIVGWSEASMIMRPLEETCTRVGLPAGLPETTRPSEVDEADEDEVADSDSGLVDELEVGESDVDELEELDVLEEAISLGGTYSPASTLIELSSRWTHQAPTTTAPTTRATTAASSAVVRRYFTRSRHLCRRVGGVVT